MSISRHDSGPADGYRTVSLAADPYDLRPAWDALTGDIEDKIRKHGRVVMLIGEYHTVPTFKSLLQGLITRLHNGASRVAFGAEWSHNHLEWLIENRLGRPLPGNLHGRVAAADRDGSHLYRAFRALSLPFYAPVSTQNLLDFCHSLSLPCHFYDSAKIHGKAQTLDQRDPATRALVEVHAPHLCDKEIGLESPDGIRLRNIMAVASLARHMDETDAQICLVKAGVRHLLGCQQRDDRYADSLTAVFTRAGFHVIPVFSELSTHDVSADRYLTVDGRAALHQQGWRLTHMAGREYDNESPSGTEYAFLEQIRHHSGSEIGIFPGMSRADGIREATPLTRVLPQWFEEARDVPPRIPDFRQLNQPK